MSTKIDASRLLIFKAAMLKDAGLPFIKDAAQAKLFFAVGILLFSPLPRPSTLISRCSFQARTRSMGDEQSRLI